MMDKVIIKSRRFLSKFGVGRASRFFQAPSRQFTRESILCALALSNIGENQESREKALEELQKPDVVIDVSGNGKELHVAYRLIQTDGNYQFYPLRFDPKIVRLKIFLVILLKVEIK